MYKKINGLCLHIHSAMPYTIKSEHQDQINHCAPHQGMEWNHFHMSDPCYHWIYLLNDCGDIAHIAFNEFRAFWTTSWNIQDIFLHAIPQRSPKLWKWLNVIYSLHVYLYFDLTIVNLITLHRVYLWTYGRVLVLSNVDGYTTQIISA